MRLTDIIIWIFWFVLCSILWRHEFFVCFDGIFVWSIRKFVAPLQATYNTIAVDVKVTNLLTTIHDGNQREECREMAAVLLRRLFASDFQDFYAAVSIVNCLSTRIAILIWFITFSATARVPSPTKTTNSVSSSTVHYPRVITKNMRCGSWSRQISSWRWWQQSMARSIAIPIPMCQLTECTNARGCTTYIRSRTECVR